MSDDTERQYDLSRAAVAIKGQGDSGATVVAKGRGALAEQILDAAFAHDVKVRQDPALVQMLDAFELDSPIPPPAMEAVAVVLARVYAANGGHVPAPPQDSVNG